MSNYTMTIKEIIESVTPQLTGWRQNRINEACKQIFDFEYPILHEEHRVELESKILRHYFMREIGLETYELWKFFLESRMNEIMPYYNELYKTLDEQFPLLWDTNLTTHNVNDMVGNVDTTYNQNVGNTLSEHATEHISGKEDENINKGGTENLTLDRDETGSLKRNDSTDENGTQSIADNTANTNSIDIVDARTKNGTNDITDNTDSTSSKDTSSTLDTTGKETYDGKSTQTQHLGEQKAVVNADYPQATIDSMDDYATSGTKEEHESDTTGNNTSLSTTDKVGKDVQASNEAVESNSDYTRDQKTTEKEDYTRGHTESGKNDYTRDLHDNKDITYNRTDNTTGNTDETQNKKWTETDTRNQTNDGWKTNDLSRTGNEVTDSNQNQQQTRNDTGWITKQGLSGNHTAVQLINEYRQSLLNIDMMIADELSDLFMNIY